jgi:hypothetical protein
LARTVEPNSLAPEIDNYLTGSHRSQSTHQVMRSGCNGENGSSRIVGLDQINLKGVEGWLRFTSWVELETCHHAEPVEAQS